MVHFWYLLLFSNQQVWFSNRRAKNRRSSDKYCSKPKKLTKTSNGCPTNSAGEDSEQTNSSGSPLSNNGNATNGNNSNNNNLPDEKPFVNTNISLNQTESALNHERLTSTSTNNTVPNSLDAGALSNDFNRANNSTLISLAARINSGFNSFYPGLHSDTYG